MSNAQNLLAAENSKYGTPLVNIYSRGNNVYVISDLHLAAGVNASGNYEGTENFYADNSFVRFLDHLQEIKIDGRALLVINGDFIDFLRILNLPETDEDFDAWQAMLAAVNVEKTAYQLRNSIVKKELEYGLKTHDFKSVWKLHVCITGHRLLFDRLALWLQDGNDLVISKGNHDLEWYWQPVRDYLQYWFASSIATRQSLAVEEVLEKTVLPQLVFIDDAMVIDDQFYLEHGHRYENTTSVKGAPLIDNKEELNLPFGSFFNRYLINRLELLYPYLDNVRPTQNILLILFRERFPFALKVLFHYVPFMILIIPKKLVWQTLKYLFTFLLVIIIPLAVTGWAIYNSLPKSGSSSNTSFIMQQVLSVAKNLGFLFLSYLIARIMVFVKLSPPNSFYPNAKDIFSTIPGIKMVSFGHTHNPEQVKDLNGWYFNTGTWIPVYESSSSDVRFDRTYTFLEIVKHKETGWAAVNLQRWNDDAQRYDLLTLNEKSKAYDMRHAFTYLFLIVAFLTCCGCNVQKIGSDLGSGVDKNTQSIGRNLVAGAQQQLTDSLFRQKLQLLLDSVITSVSGNAGRSLGNIRDSLLNDKWRLFTRQLADEITGSSTQQNVAALRETLIGDTTQRRIKALIDGALASVFSDNTKAQIEALKEQLLGTGTQQQIAALRDELLNEKTNQAIKRIVDTAMTNIAYHMNHDIKDAVNENASFIQKYAGRILITAGIVALVIIIVIWRNKEKYLKLSTLLTSQINNIPDKQVYDDVTNRIKDNAVQSGIEPTLRKILSKNGMLGKDDWQISRLKQSKASSAD